jgi:hypothetical protein
LSDFFRIVSRSLIDTTVGSGGGGGGAATLAGAVDDLAVTGTLASGLSNAGAVVDLGIDGAVGAPFPFVPFPFAPDPDPDPDPAPFADIPKLTQ